MEDVEQVDGAPHGRVEEDARATRERVRERREIGDAAVRDDELRVGMRLDEAVESLRDGWEPASTVNEDRHATLGCEREDRTEPLVGQVEALGPRVKLDPAGATVEAAAGFLHRALGKIEANERDQHAAAGIGRRERPVVRRAEGRMPVRLVEAEGERARDPVAAHHGKELVGVADEAVDVAPHVDVCVEDLGMLGDERAELVVVGGEERVRPLEDVGRAHAMSVTEPGG